METIWNKLLLFYGLFELRHLSFLVTIKQGTKFGNCLFSGCDKFLDDRNLTTRTTHTLDTEPKLNLGFYSFQTENTSREDNLSPSQDLLGILVTLQQVKR